MAFTNTDPTWTDAQLLRWMKEAEVDVTRELSMQWARFSIAITASTGTYTISNRLKEITSVMWKGKQLRPLIGKEAHAVEEKFRTVEGEPTHYTVSNDGITTIRLIPVPNADIAEYSDGLFSTNITNAFLISGYVFPDRDAETFQMPDYLVRPLAKSYVMWKAFQKEGNGQNLKAAQYWQEEYANLLAQLGRKKAKFFASKERLDLEFIPHMQRRHARLPYQFTIPKPTLDLYASGADSLNNWADNLSVVLS